MNIKEVAKEIRKGNNPIILKDVVDGTTYYHTIMFVGLFDERITTTVWATDGRLPNHLQDSRAKTLKSFTGKAFDYFAKCKTQPMMVNAVLGAYMVLNSVMEHIHDMGGVDTYTAKVIVN